MDRVRDRLFWIGEKHGEDTAAKQDAPGFSGCGTELETAGKEPGTHEPQAMTLKERAHLPVPPYGLR
jgi:hypothetical protein